MALKSTLFRNDPALQACSTSDPAHLTLGAKGEHVGRLQFSLFATDGLGIDDGESSSKSYGPSTAAAVLAYKTRRSIINRAYQTKADNICGKMTIASLDREMLAKEGKRGPQEHTLCGSDRSSGLGRVASRRSGSDEVAAGIQPVSFRNSLVGAPSVSAPPAPEPPPKSPGELAIGQAAAAQSAITKTRTALFELINFRPVSANPAAPILPPLTMALFDKVWRNFGQPSPLPITSFGEFPPINNLKDFLGAIDSHYALMERVVTRASTLFRTVDQAVLGKRTFALTITNDRVDGDPPGLAVGIHFGSLFAGSTPNRQTEIVVHETGHFKDGHHFGDPITPDSSNWGKFDGSIGILNAWSYSMFMLDVVFNRTTPFPN